MSFRQVVPALNEPLTLDEVRIHLRQAVDATVPFDPAEPIEASPDDSWVEVKITAARLWAEQFLGVLLSDAIYQANYDAFAEWMEVPFGTALIDGILYLDASGVIQTLDPAGYVFDDALYVTPVLPTSTRANAVRVRVQGAVTDLEDIKHAMLLLIGHWYENREAASPSPLSDIPFGVEALLRPHRVRLGMA